MPSIEDTIRALFRLFGSRDAVFAMMHTFVRLGLSIGISLALALIMAFLSYRFRHVETFLHPYMVLFKTIPLVSVILITFVLVHFSLTTYIITFLMIFPILYQAILSGLNAIDQSYIDVYKLEKGTFLSSIEYLYFPMTKPFILLGFLQSLGLGLKVIVMAEFITQAQNGIGRLIYQARVNLKYDQIFAITIILVLMTFLIETLVKKYNQDIEKA
jgi:NitT/TauT family transport system permease protein